VEGNVWFWGVLKKSFVGLEKGWSRMGIIKRGASGYEIRAHVDYRELGNKTSEYVDVGKGWYSVKRGRKDWKSRALQLAIEGFSSQKGA